MTKAIQFLKNAILGEGVGAIARSSQYVINAILERLEGSYFDKIIEYGPGDGVLTIELLKHLSPDGKMLLVEMDDNFVDILKKIDDPRLTIVQGKMQDVSTNLDKYGFTGADLILSSVPFSLISKKERDSVVKNTYNSLNENGRVIIFHQYSKIMEGLLNKYFKMVETSFEPRNILPCFIMFAQKK